MNAAEHAERLATCLARIVDQYKEGIITGAEMVTGTAIQLDMHAEPILAVDIH